jgi:hypothetical protein
MPSFLFNNGTFFDPAAIPPTVLTPVTGNTITMGYPSLYLTPAGTLATLTIKLPPNPRVNSTATIVSTTVVTALTMQTATGGAVAGSPTALVANTAVLMRYLGSSLGWAWVH